LEKKLQKGLAAKTILLVEDDKDFSAMIQTFLAEHGYTVVQARNGAQGVKRILEQDFDVILCDMVMPNFPGDMFYRAVQLTKAHLCERFIFMTGHHGEEHITNFIREIKGLMLWKPFPFHVLMEAIKTIEVKRKRSAPSKRI
jgi:DNA-binding response OmpR family regulator